MWTDEIIELLEEGMTEQEIIADFTRSLETAKKFTAEELATAQERIEAEALARTAKTHWLERNKSPLDEKEAKQIAKRFKEYNERCAAANTATFALASNICERVESGEDFAELARQYDQDESRLPDGTWGEYTAEDFRDEPELLRISRSFKPGCVTPPVEADNGLMIARVDKIEDPSANPEEDGYIPSAEAVFSLSRIFLRLPEFIEEADFDTLKREAQKAKDNAAFAKFIRERASKLGTEYPSGVEIFSVKEDEPVAK